MTTRLKELGIFTNLISKDGWFRLLLHYCQMSQLWSFLQILENFSSTRFLPNCIVPLSTKISFSLLSHSIPLPTKPSGSLTFLSPISSPLPPLPYFQFTEGISSNSPSQGNSCILLGIFLFTPWILWSCGLQMQRSKTKNQTELWESNPRE